VAPPRVNLGHVANFRFIKKSGELIATGNQLWMRRDDYKRTGTINLALVAS
jgi:hypothetical protein